MRVTDGLIFSSALVNTARAREAAQEAQQQASSGVRVSHPSDDPAASGLIVAFNMSTDRFQAISDAATQASSELGVVDSSLGDISNVLSRARELAVQFSNAGYPQSQSAGGAQEVDGILGQVVADLNTRFGNRYVFGGNVDNAPPFDAAGNYTGDDGVRKVEIAPGVLEASSVRADVAIKGVGGGVDVLQTLAALRDALNANDTDAIRATLDDLDSSISQVSQARSQAGVSMNAFDTATSAAKLASNNYKTNAGKQADVDVIESAIKLQSTQTALQASLSSTAQSFQLSLVNFLK
jgi:flagellar hook-associated protein 3 FlgL